VVRSDPEGAEVLIGDKTVGTTPAVLNVALPQEIVVRHEGYRASREVLAAPGTVTVKLSALRRAATEKRPLPTLPAAPPQKPPAESQRPARETLD
jgi:hypothetical protein